MRKLGSTGPWPEEFFLDRLALDDAVHVELDASAFLGVRRGLVFDVQVIAVVILVQRGALDMDMTGVVLGH